MCLRPKIKQGHKQTHKHMNNHTRKLTCKQTHKTTKIDNNRWQTKAMIASKQEDTKDKDRHNNF